MNKQDIDKEFTQIYPMLQKIALGILYKKGNKHLDADGVVSEAYLYLLQNKDKVKTQDQMQRLIINWIKQNIGWQNSQLNLKNKVNTITANYVINEEPIEDDFDITNKLKIEEWYTNKLCILELYRQQEEDKIYQIIFDLYFTHGHTTGAKLAESLKISNSYGSAYVKALHNRIQSFNEKYNNNTSI